MTTTEKLQLIDLLQKYQQDLLASDKKNAELRNQIKLSNSWDEKDMLYKCIRPNCSGLYEHARIILSRLQREATKEIEWSRG